jgi:predicted small secreted protein
VCTATSNDSAIVNTAFNACNKDSLVENKCLIKDKYVIMKADDTTSEKKETWKEKYAGVILGALLGFIFGIMAFYLQQRIINHLSKKIRIKDYKQAINNYIDYITATAGSDDLKIIELAKNLFFPIDGSYIKESQNKIFKEKVNTIRKSLIDYKTKKISLIDFIEQIKKQRFNNG